MASDEFSSLFRTELCKACRDLSRANPVEQVSSCVTMHLQHQERRHMFTYPGATFHLVCDDLDLGYIADARHFHMSSYYP